MWAVTWVVGVLTHYTLTPIPILPGTLTVQGHRRPGGPGHPLGIIIRNGPTGSELSATGPGCVLFLVQIKANENKCRGTQQLAVFIFQLLPRENFIGHMIDAL